MKRFDWSNFNGDFLEAVVYSPKTDKDIQPVAKPNDADMLIASMNLICLAPDTDFVMTYRREIEDKFFRNYPDVVKGVTKSLNDANYLNVINELSRQEMTSTLAAMYVKALFMIGSGEYAAEHISKFANVVTVDLRMAMPEGEVPLYNFQNDAVKALKKHFIDDNKKSGILVMPTGSGKTRTSAAFLLQHMISDGYQVVWLTHRHMLIDQAAEVFYKNSPVIKLFNPKTTSFKLACVSGEHQTVKALERDDSVMVISVQSACRGLEHIKRALGRKVVIVVDEAHHTVARSYKKTIDFIRKHRKNVKLLGLTATPVRANDIESSYLMRLFDNNIIYSIPMSTLISKGILATPQYEPVETGENFEVTMSLDEKKYIKRWGELSTSLVEKIARSSQRNSLILEQYLKNRERYGKTIIFALNGVHAYTLWRDFTKNGIKCGYVYSNNDREYNEKIIRDFKDGRLDVLININILTEGSDVPDIETVFLTRPTASEVLLMQMIGRGMRGVEAGGTEKVNIVDFNDKWDSFNKWLNPKLLLDNQDEIPEEKETAPAEKPHLIPWGMVRDIYSSMMFYGGKLKSGTAIPYGWYNLLDDGEDYRLIVFEDQYESYQNIIRDKKALMRAGEVTAKGLRKAYFSGFVLTPSDEDIKIFWDNVCSDQQPPEFFRFDWRESIDPHMIAKKIIDENLNLLTYPTEVFDKNPVVAELYGTVEHYREIVFDIINYGGKKQTGGYKVEEMPIELIPFKIDKPYDIQQLTNEVIDEMFGGSYSGISSIAWTDKPYKRYYGVFYYGDNSIKINILLNSSQVPREAVKYVIYHELLHRDYHGHDRVFREMEHKYPDYTEHEHFLDYKFGSYKLER